jgi:hypothetical protein
MSIPQRWSRTWRRPSFSRAITRPTVALSNESGPIFAASVAWMGMALALLLTECAGDDTSSKGDVGPSCPQGAPGQGGLDIAGVSNGCLSCMEGSACLPTVEGAQCTYSTCYTYYACFCACGKLDAACHAACLADEAGAGCRTCIDAVVGCAGKQCKSECSRGNQWIGDAG